MSDTDKIYFQRRLREETEMAAHATDPRVASRHFELARAYSERMGEKPEMENSTSARYRTVSWA